LFLGLCVPTIATPSAGEKNTASDDDDDWDDEDSSEADDDGRVYKNPRNSPSTECPRDEEQATLLVRFMLYTLRNFCVKVYLNSQKKRKILRVY
jgi:hypothetical protein